MEEKEASFNREVIESGQADQLQKLREGFDQLQGKCERVAQQEKTAYGECMEQLKQKRAEAEAKVTEMQENQADGFYDLSLDAQIALDELKEALGEAEEKFGEPTEPEKT